MGKVRSVEYDGGIKTKYIQESDGKLTINNQQDVNPLLKRNKELYNHDRGWLSSQKPWHFDQRNALYPFRCKRPRVGIPSYLRSEVRQTKVSARC